jgi:DNA-binding NarL/FixJ family response regulator
LVGAFFIWKLVLNHYLSAMKDVEIISGMPDGTAVLTLREVEVLQCLADGLTVRETGEKLLISPKTVQVHRQNVLQKTEAKKVIQVCMALYKKGIIK